MIETIGRGDARALARAATLVESGRAGELLKELFPRTGRALIIGVTGAPGAGKSTFCDQLVETLRAEGMHPGAVHAIAAHNDDGLAHTGIRCVSVLDHAVSCAEAVVGLVHATSQVLPSKDVRDVKASSVVKRYKDPKFAPTIERPLIARCAGLGLSIEDFLALATEAVQQMPAAP